MTLAGVSQLPERPAFLEESGRAFFFFLRQPVQSLPAPEEQSGGGGHVVGDSQRAQHLHWLPAQQSVPPSHTEGKRGLLSSKALLFGLLLWLWPPAAVSPCFYDVRAGSHPLLVEYVPPSTLHQVPLRSSGRSRLHPCQQRLLLRHSVQVRNGSG